LYTSENTQNEELLKKAVELFKKAAKANSGLASILAASHLGKRYFYGLGVPQDFHKARKYLERAAAQGNSCAQLDLGTMYLEDSIVQDYTKGVFFIKCSADQGNKDAQFTLGALYESGEGVSVDPEKAFEYYSLAASQNFLDAAFNVAVSFHTGEGVPQNLKKAQDYYQLCADDGDEEAKTRLRRLRSISEEQNAT